MNTFSLSVAAKKAEADFYQANKRQIVANQMLPRVAPPSVYGRYFEETILQDPNHLFMKSLLPLDKVPLQE